MKIDNGYSNYYNLINNKNDEQTAKQVQGKLSPHHTDCAGAKNLA